MLRMLKCGEPIAHFLSLSSLRLASPEFVLYSTFRTTVDHSTLHGKVHTNRVFFLSTYLMKGDSRVVLARHKCFVLVAHVLSVCSFVCARAL